jgi:hypothetical protein
VPGSVNVAEMSTDAPPAANATGTDGSVNGASVGATFAIVAVACTVCVPPLPSDAVSAMANEPLSA